MRYRECNCSLTDQVYDYSSNHFGVPLCMPQQKWIKNHESTDQTIALCFALKERGIQPQLEMFDSFKHIDIELAGSDVLAGLLSEFVAVIINPEDAKSKRLLLKMPEQFQTIIKSKEETYYKKLLVSCDFVSRMTDGHAMKLYKKLKGI